MTNFIKTIPGILLSPFLLRDFFAFKAKGRKRFLVRCRDITPLIWDNTRQTHFDRHYIYHTAWAARLLAETRPAKHVDISSSLYFSGIASAFVPIDFYDYRPAHLTLSNLVCGRADLTKLPFPDESILSLSCMHTVEHVGLGRYGDTIDPDGDLKAIKELKRVLAPGGSLLLVVPLGNKPKIEFNAHRIYAHEQVVSYFPELELKEFSLIPEHETAGGLIKNADPHLLEKESWACGCFWFLKVKTS